MHEMVGIASLAIVGMCIFNEMFIVISDIWRDCADESAIKKQLVHTPRCQINESTRLLFLDFSPTLYLDMSYLIFHPTCLFGRTHFAFSPYTFIWPHFL